MASIVKGLIEYSGIADIFPKRPLYFKQMDVQEDLTIPSAKPDIEQISKVIVKADIVNTQLVKTPKGISWEGQELTGWKLIISGELYQKVEYVADEATQSVHSAHFKMPFCTYVVLSESFKCDKTINVIPYIEDVSVQQIDSRHLFKDVVLFLDVIVS